MKINDILAALLALLFFVGGLLIIMVALVNVLPHLFPFVGWFIILLLGLYAVGFGLYGLHDIFGSKKEPSHD